MTEPLPPVTSTFAHRLYHRLPQVYRTMDSRQEWLLKRYINAVCFASGEMEQLIEDIGGSRAIGPATPEPWGLSSSELEVWRRERVRRWSTLGDPDTAELAWLPWLASMVGAPLDPSASETEQRDTIRYATSGWRAGTRGAIADAAKSALTGTKYAQIAPHKIPSWHGGLEDGSVWDVTIVTRASETPDPNAVLGAVLRKGVKPAGVVLWHTDYEANWDQIEAVYPTWADWEAAGSWDRIEEAGLSFVPTPGNLLPNPSFEVNDDDWSGGYGGNTTIGQIDGGIDGVGMLRATATGAGAGEVLSPAADITAPGTAEIGFSVRPTQSRSGQWVVEYRDAGFVTLSFEPFGFGALPANEWTRLGQIVTLPPGTAYVTFYLQLFGMAASETYDFDAALVRRVT